MDSLQTLLSNFSEVHRFFAYAIIFFFVLIEGESILLLAGILSRHGYLKFSLLFLIAFGASILHDYLYWSIGKNLALKSSGKFLFFHLEKTKKFLESLKHKKRDGFYIFFSKFAWGLTKITYIICGYAKMSFLNLCRYAIPASFIWTLSLLSLGYVFASETHILRKNLGTAAILILLLILLFLALEYILRKSIKKELE